MRKTDEFLQEFGAKAACVTERGARQKNCVVKGAFPMHCGPKAVHDSRRMFEEFAGLQSVVFASQKVKSTQSSVSSVTASKQALGKTDYLNPQKCFQGVPRQMVQKSPLALPQEAVLFYIIITGEYRYTPSAEWVLV